MSEPLLNVMKIMLLAGLYLFFVRVLWSVFSELRDPRTVARKRARKPASGNRSHTPSRPQPAAVAAPVAPAPAGAMYSGGQPAFAGGEAAGGVATAVAAGRLAVIDPPQAAGASYSIGREITLGRANTNGIVLDDTYVSTVHARIFNANGTYLVEDLASRNGSTLNGMPIVATTALVPGDRLQLGATTMEFS